MARRPAQPDADAFRRDQTTQAEQSHTSPLPARRPDLILSPQLYLGKTVYMVKDPVSLMYYRLRPPEHFTLMQLDGRTSAQQVAERLNRKYPDEPTSPDAVVNFAQMLYRAGMLLGRDEQHAQRLRQMGRERKRKKRLAIAASFLFLKLPLIDPDRMLGAIYSYVAPLMNRFTMSAALLFMIVSAAAAMVGLHRVGDLEFGILSWQNLLMLSATFLGIKVLHEFGHGLAAKHRGLEVHEMGVLLIVLFPLFYVETSDAWMLPRKRDRLWITAGGVFLEMILAAGAAWVWLNTEPGWANQLAFNAMLTASVTSVLFNANPLLRYDGYYFLMDVMEVPNLRDKAQKYIAYLAKKYVLAMPDQAPPHDTEGKPVFMVLFAMASFCYRWLVVFGIIAVVWHVLDPYGLEAVGAMLGMAALVTMVGIPFSKLVRFMWKVQARTWRRAAATVGGAVTLGAVAMAILAIPMEQTVEQPAVIMAAARRPLYLQVSGRVEEVLVEHGESLVKDQPILRLSNEHIEQKLGEFRIERRLEQLQLSESRLRGRNDQVAASVHKLARITSRIDYYLERQRDLTVQAPIDGRLQVSRRLETLIGVFVEKGQTLGTIVGSGGNEVVVIVPQQDASRIQPGMVARLRLWSLPDRTLVGEVRRVGSKFLRSMPHDALASVYGGEVDTRMTEQQTPRPAEASVITTIALSATDAAGLTDGMTGRTKIVLDDSRHLGAQLWRKIRTGISLDWWL